jgi:hypothetical protein
MGLLGFSADTSILRAFHPQREAPDRVPVPWLPEPPVWPVGPKKGAAMGTPMHAIG